MRLSRYRSPILAYRLIEAALDIGMIRWHTWETMSPKEREKMDEILDLVDGLRVEAGHLAGDKWEPAFEAERADAIAEYLEDSVISCTDRMNAIRNIIERADRIRTQMSEERDAVGMKRETFFRALEQLDPSCAKTVLAKINAMEEARAQKDKGEFASMSVWQAAKIILERAGREMATKEIADALRAGGKILGPKATSALSAALRTGKAADVFQPVRLSGQRQRWKLKEPAQAPLLEGEDTE